MKRIIQYIIVTLWAVALAGCSSGSIQGDLLREERFPNIFPDYTRITLPANIAPANFLIEEEGERYQVKISGKKGSPIVINQSGPDIRIPFKQWKSLLAENQEENLLTEILVRKDGKWRQYKTFENFISADGIDPYLYYRDIVPTNSLWNKMAMHQRDMESFKEYELIDNHRIEHNCMNCHTFNRNNPKEMLFHVRGNNGGTVFYQNGELSKIEFPVPQLLSAGAYCNWHPGGKLVAFAVNKIKQNYYLSGYSDKMKEVFDLESDIILYNTETNTVFSFPQIASPQRENLPAWSADGKTLYYVSAPPHITNMPNEEILYSLMRVSYDITTNRLGEPEQMISSDEIGGSISFPTVSPDGRYMFFCVAEFGYFPVNNKSADLWLMDLSTGAYTKPPINSNESESYITWSSNSRWFVFSSRQLDGMTSKPFLCHIDASGNISKPFILPQEDPYYYQIDHRNFSRPELLFDRVDLDFGDLSKVIYSEATMASYHSGKN